MTQGTCTTYKQEKANQYDAQSCFDKGDRELQRNYLIDTVSFTMGSPRSFIDLGCGTGFFADALFKAFPDIHGTLIDGSEEMLTLARKRLNENNINVTYQCSLLQELDWSTISKPDFIFSSLTVHFLDDNEMLKVFQRIHDTLPQGGMFILFEQFTPKEEPWSLLLEYLACKDLKRRIEAQMQLEFELDELKIDNLIAKARKAKIDDHEQDASLSEYTKALECAGFSSICTLFQESRFFGLATIK